MGAIGEIAVDGLKQWEASLGVMEEIGGGGGRTEKISVSVRLRPLSEKEMVTGEMCDWECINDTTIIFRSSLPESNILPAAYSFDRVFRPECSTKQVYEEAVKEVALSAVSGINSSVFAYGQTSSGKTYTMNGITAYTVADIYNYIRNHDERAFTVKFSAMEIYNEAVRDLLSNDSSPLRLLDDPDRGTIIEKLTEEILRDWGHLKDLISISEANRKIGETTLNEKSSRSHQILKLTIESYSREFFGVDNTSKLVASVNFVDLAGSERASQALSTGARLKEGCYINRSLLTLGTVIRKLSNGRNVHIPYRESKLTRILQPSLGGNARTAIICTMCPARNHVEQSKNTLLFASCAKEVVTNAQVNVVMSDKALVKHLQKELARLESELKYPVSACKQGHFEALLKEKDAQIRKMEKEIKELTQELYLAQSQLEDLLCVTQDDRASKSWEEVSSFPNYQATNGCEGVVSVSDTLRFGYPATSNHCNRFSLEHGSNNYPVSNGCKSVLSVSDASGFGYPATGGNHFSLEHGNNICRGSRQKYFEKQTSHRILSPRDSSSNFRLTSQISMQSSKGDVQDFFEDDEELCREVRCVESDESIAVRKKGPNFMFIDRSENMPSLVVESNNHDDESQDTVARSMGSTITGSSFVTLEQQLKNVRKTVVNLAKPYPDVLPSSSLRDLSSSEGLDISRSRSCRATLMSGHSSSCFSFAEKNDSTPSSSVFLKDCSEKPEGFQRKNVAVNYMDENEILEGLREMSHIKLQNDITEDQVKHYNANKGSGSVATAVDVGVDPVQSPSRWHDEFEKKQEEIIVLWDECNVSLIHRTYFFLLFKGEPADSIYVEVELRRLSFLRNTLSQNSPYKKAIFAGKNINMVLSRRKLRRERKMLFRCMHKRLTSEDRKSLYMRWGIPLDSKQRKLQLAHSIWSDTTDMEHIRESAALVARLTGLLDPEKALKEMFGLSFTPQQTARRSYSWIHGISTNK